MPKIKQKAFDPPDPMGAHQFKYIRENILELRQVELAELIGVRPHSVWRYERGLRAVPRMLAFNMRLLGSIKGTLIGQQFGL
jgi:DNA-binding XRE family transcriptional regulator